MPWRRSWSVSSSSSCRLWIASSQSSARRTHLTSQKRFGGSEPGLARVVPVHQKIDGRSTILAYEDTRQMIEGARSFRVMDCICRKEHALLDKPCSHTLEACLSFSKEENAYDDSHLGGRIINKEEALAVLDAAEEEGLVHCTYNFEHNQMFVCNCCSCCCGLMRLLTEYHTPYGLVRSNWEAVIDEDLCETCGVCANERCPVEAQSKKPMVGTTWSSATAASAAACVW